MHLFERGSKQSGSVLHPELSLSVEIHSLGMTSQLASIQARDLCIGQIAYRLSTCSVMQQIPSFFPADSTLRWQWNVQVGVEKGTPYPPLASIHPGRGSRLSWDSDLILRVYEISNESRERLGLSASVRWNSDSWIMH